MILYHGSNIAITQIDLSKSKPNKDFGQGFYLSDSEQQAIEMANYKTSLFGGNPIVTRFEFNEAVFQITTLCELKFLRIIPKNGPILFLPIVKGIRHKILI